MAFEATPSTPPRAKRPRHLISQPSTTARSPPRRAQIVFSPGRRVCADGLLHDPSDEVAAFLQQRGYSRAEIDAIMVQRAMPAATRAGAHPGEPSKRARSRPLFADHVRKLGCAPVRCFGTSDPSGCRQSGAAPTGGHVGSHAVDDFDLADLCDVLTQPCCADPASFLLSQLPEDFQAELAAAAAEAERSPFLLSQLPEDFQAELAAAAAEAERGAASASQPVPVEARSSAWAPLPCSRSPVDAAHGASAEGGLWPGWHGVDAASTTLAPQSLPLEDHAFLFQAIGEVEGALMRERQERMTQAASQSQHCVSAGAPPSCRSQAAAFSFSSP